jgi:hypothetical protein
LDRLNASLETIAKLVLAWFGNPIRGLGAAVIAAPLVLWLRSIPYFNTAFQDAFWRWPTLIFIVAFAGLITFPLEHGWRSLKTKLQEWKRIARLKELTPHEKKVLGRYLLEETTALPWGRGGGVVDELARDSILHLLTAVPLMPMLRPIPEQHVEALSQDMYAIDSVIWKHLRAHPEVVDLEHNRPVTPSSV